MMRHQETWRRAIQISFGALQTRGGTMTRQVDVVLVHFILATTQVALTAAAPICAVYFSFTTCPPNGFEDPTSSVGEQLRS